MKSILTILLSFISYALVHAGDIHENCKNWAQLGECDKNPGWMLKHCSASCKEIMAQAAADSKELEGIKSFFNLSANDIHGNMVEFSQFKGQVTIIVNVASFCGYTDSHYKQLVQLWSEVKHTDMINILAFPCNQFGSQEPKSNNEIFDFAVGYGVDFRMMSKVDVNGGDASLVYKYLKREAGPAFIEWNFATYFVVSPDGAVTSHSGVQPMDLKDVAFGFLEEEL